MLTPKQAESAAAALAMRPAATQGDMLACPACVAAYMTWPTDRHLVQSLGGSFMVVMFIVLAATLRRLPLAAD